MKKLLFFLAAFIIVCKMETFSQGLMGWDAKFAFGGGFTPGWFFPKLDVFNDQLGKLGVTKLTNSGFFATGGTGYVSLPMLKNIRIGGMGLGGSTSENSTVNGFNREADYSVSMGGVTVEYSFPFIPSVAVSVGTVIGGGNVTLKIYQNQGAANWNNIWGEFNPGASTQDIHRELSNSFFMVAPTLNVDIPVNRFFAFRVGGGYQIPIGGKWKVDNGQIINNVPDNINRSSVFIQTGIFIGYFNY